jgi:hypothetical protein
MTVESAPVSGPGEVVRARQRRYLEKGVTLPPADGDATLPRQDCLDDAQGQPLEVLRELEPDARPLVASG